MAKTLIDDPLFERLGTLGFSGYEARAYVALLKNHPATGYELAKHSGIPPSKIYPILKKLKDRSMILPTSEKPVKYMPQNSKLFLKNLRRDFQSTMVFLEENLPSRQSSDFDYVWNLRQKKDLMAKAVELIEQAKKEIIMLAWDQEFRELTPALDKLRKSVKVAVIQFGDDRIDHRLIYRHRIPDVIESEKGGRELTLVVDNEFLLQGLIMKNGAVHGIHTSNPSLVQVALDYMRHEIYTNKIFNRFEKQLFAEYGETLDKLRDIWHP
jgi:HTH-type transcriptional regulator, sugar sensing transcriptional regulator